MPFLKIFLQIHSDENKIGEKGAKALSEKLLGKVSLKRLILSHNLINSKGSFNKN